MALARLGRDGNGSLLHSERVSWLDENGIDDPSERDFCHFLFDAADAERASVHHEQMDKINAKR